MFKRSVVMILVALAVAGCSKDGTGSGTAPVAALQPCSEVLTDGQRMEAISVTVKTDPPELPGCYLRYWIFEWVPSAGEYLVFYDAVRHAYPPLYQRHAWGPTLRQAMDNVISQLWFTPEPGQQHDEARISWLDMCCARSAYNDCTVYWDCELHPADRFYAYWWKWEQDSPYPSQEQYDGGSPRELVEICIKRTGWSPEASK